LKIQGLDAFPNHCENGRDGGRFGHMFVFCGAGRTWHSRTPPPQNRRGASNVQKCQLNQIQLHRLDKLGLKAFLEWLGIPRFGCLPKNIAKPDGWVVVLAFILCIVGWGTRRFKCTEMSI